MKKINRKTNMKKIVLTVTTAGLITGLIGVSGCNISNKDKAKIINTINKEHESGLDDTIAMMKEVEQRYLNNYVDDIDYEQVKYYTVNAMIQAFGDKYGAYLDEEHVDIIDNKLTNSVKGIGVLIRAEINEDKDYDQLYVIDVYADSGAEKAGLKTGDIITKVNEKSFKFNEELTFDNLIRNEIKGSIGTTCTITYIDNKDNKEKTVEVERSDVKTTSVKYEKINNNIGYIKINEFGINTVEEFKTALDYMLDNNINKVVFDLRGNSGGLLDSAKAMIDCFLPEMDALYITDKDGNIEEVQRTKNNNEYNISGVCLVNNKTASAAELFTQTLHDYGLAKTIGEKTVGKGTVCSVEPTTDGGELSLSSNRYQIFNHTEIEGKGVTIDYELKLPEEKQKIDYKLPLSEDDLVQKAIEVINETEE